MNKKTILISAILLIEVLTLKIQRSHTNRHEQIQLHQNVKFPLQIDPQNSKTSNALENAKLSDFGSKKQAKHDVWYFTNWNRQNSEQSQVAQKKNTETKRQSSRIVQVLPKEQTLKNNQQVSIYGGSPLDLIDEGRLSQNEGVYLELAPAVTIQDQQSQKQTSRQQSSVEIKQQKDTQTVQLSKEAKVKQQRFNEYQNQKQKLNKFKKTENGCLKTPYTLYCPQDLQKINRNIFQDTLVLINQKPYQYEQDFGLVCVNGDNQIKIHNSTQFLAKDQCEGPEACANMLLKFKALCAAENQTIWKVPFQMINYGDLQFYASAAVKPQQLVKFIRKQDFQKQSPLKNDKEGGQEQDIRPEFTGLKPVYLQPKLVYQKSRSSHLHNLKKID